MNLLVKISSSEFTHREFGTDFDIKESGWMLPWQRSQCTSPVYTMYILHFIHGYQLLYCLTVGPSLEIDMSHLPLIKNQSSAEYVVVL